MLQCQLDDCCMSTLSRGPGLRASELTASLAGNAMSCDFAAVDFMLKSLRCLQVLGRSMLNAANGNPSATTKLDRKT